MSALSAKQIKWGLLITIVMVMAVSACQTDPQFQLYKKVTFKNNERFGTPVYNPAEKGLSPAAFELGRRLFYDPRLSINDQISCGSCHQAVAAFAHADHDFSHGVNNKLGLRNSPVLFNLAWHDAFFWDGGVNHIESQPINPIEDTLEMGIKLPDLLVKLNKIDDYDELMKEVYGSDTFTSARLFKSLALFMTMMVSDESKWDAVDAGKESFTNSEAQGAMLFQKHCTHCHTPPLFTNLGYHSNGLPPATRIDSGRARITHNMDDMFKFKVPTLRNIEFSAPYMHDGRFKTLDAVLDHYTNLANAHNLDTFLINNPINLTTLERNQLKQFLLTLSDTSFIQNKLFHEQNQ